MAEGQTAVAGATETQYERFLRIVREAAGLDHDSAEQATHAVLRALAERISAGEAAEMAERLGAELGPWIATRTGAEPFDAEEFLRRIAEREHVDRGTAERHARAVLLALSQIAGADEFDDMTSQLPRSFAPLLPRGEVLERMPAAEFVTRVAERARLDAETAKAATAAVLETLGERVTRGEVEDLIEQLPAELHEPLRRGDQLSNGAARRMSLDTFVRLVAEREGVEPLRARGHIRAVFATLREAVAEKEWLDMTAQLPQEFAAVSARS
jgi:uncharacterized protein (DUF2267 family)